MSAQTPRAIRATHIVASEIHRVMAARGMDTAALARAIGHSSRFISSLLKGENGNDRLINIRLLQEVANATNRTLTIKIPPEKSANHDFSVKSEGTP